jgi:hypothetical protein
MKTMVLIFVAVLGIVLGATALSPGAHTSDVHQYPPSNLDSEGWG